MLLLACAQHAALTHAVWHGTGAEEHAQGQGHGHHDRGPGHDREDDAHGELCAFHLALGQVLGADRLPAVLTLCAACASDASTPAAHPRIASEAIRPLSRGPPLLL